MLQYVTIYNMNVVSPNKEKNVCSEKLFGYILTITEPYL